MVAPKPADHLRGVAVLAAAFMMFVLGTPGFDLLNAERWLPGSKARARQLERPLGTVAVLAADVNRTVRLPLVDVLTPLQRPLRLAQSWGLYGAGPRDVRRFEIYVDDRLVYRSADPEHAWLRAELRYRKLRPIVDAHCTGESKNSEGLAGWIVARAREDFPEATAVRIGCTVRPWPTQPPGPDDPPVELTWAHQRRAAAPTWTVTR